MTADQTLIRRASNAGFWAATIGTPLATFIVALALIGRIELNDEASKVTLMFVAFSLVVTSLRYHLRCQFCFRQDARVDALSSVDSQVLSLLIAVHASIIFFCCINIAILSNFSIILAASIFSLQSALLIVQWAMAGQSIISAGLKRLAGGDKTFIGQHALTFILDLVTLILATLMMLSIFNVADDLGAATIGVAMVLFIFTIIEIIVHTRD